MSRAGGLRSGNLQRAVAGALALASLSAFAQSRWTTHVEFPLEVSRDSNPGLSVAATPAVTRYLARPLVRSTYTDGPTDFSLSAGMTLERTLPATTPDRQDPKLRGDWRHAGPRGTVDVYALYEQNAYRGVGIEELVPFGVDGTRRLMAFGGGLRRDLSEVASIGLTARHDRTSFSTPGTSDFGLASASARYTRSLDDVSAWYLAGDMQRYAPEAGTAVGTLSDSRSGGLLVGWRTGLLEGRVNVDVSAGQMRFAGPSAGSSWQGNAKVTYARPFNDIVFEASRRASPVVSSSALGSVTLVRLSSRSVIGENASLAAEYARVTSSGLTPSRQDLISLAYVRELSPRLQAAVRVERRAREQQGFGRVQGTLLSAGLTYTHPDL